jgi:hypothetical protein
MHEIAGVELPTLKALVRPTQKRPVAPVFVFLDANNINGNNHTSQRARYPGMQD